MYVKGKIGGLENYVRNIVSGIDAFQQSRGQAITVFAHETEVDHVREIAPHARILPVIHETSDRVIHEELDASNYDVLFCPLLVLDPLTARVPSAVMMPDLQHEFFPEFFDSNTLKWRRQTYRPSTIHASHIYTLSEHAKSTIVKMFRADPEKIEVVYLDVDHEFRTAQPGSPSTAFQALGLPARYLFYPANFWPHKNHTNLLKALKLVVERFPDLGLVLTGSNDGVERIQYEVAELGLRKHVYFPGYVDRQVLVELYQHSQALTFVSRFEGFGIPILEAFHTRTPVITSRAGSCSEIAGGAALLVDEMEPAGIAAGIVRILEEPLLCESLRAAGQNRAERFSWQKALDATLASFSRITRNPAMARSHIEVREYPVVSIVTPTYNMGRFIKQTVDSVLTQDYPHIDYIVMDAGSKDETVEILNSYNGRLRYESKPDKGQADAVNKGFAISRGRVFTFLNADDTYLPGAVSAAVGHMMANPSMGVVYGEANYVQEDGTNIGRYPTLPFDPQTLNRCCFICQPASFMWSDVFQTAGGMNPDLHFALDYDLWIRIAKQYPMLKVDDVLATSRMYRENKTLGKRRPVYMEIMSTVKAHYGYVPFDWVFGYSSYLLDRKDQFFDVSHPSFTKIALSFLIGSYYNKLQMPRYWQEWARHLGLFATFSGKYGDGWISKRYVTDCSLTSSCEKLRILGRHLAPFKKGLDLTIKFEGQVLQRIHVNEHGEFAAEIHCPPEIRGRTGQLVIEADRTFRPGSNGDYRRLSCLIDAMEFEEPKERD